MAVSHVLGPAACSLGSKRVGALNTTQSQLAAAWAVPEVEAEVEDGVATAVGLCIGTER